MVEKIVIHAVGSGGKVASFEVSVAKGTLGEFVQLAQGIERMLPSFADVKALERRGHGREPRPILKKATRANPLKA